MTTNISDSPRTLPPRLRELACSSGSGLNSKLAAVGTSTQPA
jgi:hypothetical protein